MDRSSSQRDLRADRLARTPYSRPQTTTGSGSTSKKTSQSPFASLKSLVSYVSSPFTRSSLLPTHTHTNPNSSLAIELDPNQDQKSESGSEDEWNGEPPETMENQDIFSLAAAAGRQGYQFEKRAATWRARGEKPGGRRQAARLQLGIEAAPSALLPVGPPTPNVPGHFAIRPSPSMPALMSNSSLSKAPSSMLNNNAVVERRFTQPEAEASTSTLKRTRSPPITNGTLPFRPPLPAFMPPSTPAAMPSSASSVALSAFLEAKKGQQMTVEDFRVIETLTDNMKTELHVGSSQREEKLGGWAAGSYPSSIRQSQSLANLSTPARTPGALLTTPGPVFSVGLNLAPGAGGKSSPYRQRYLGPGMSPRRMFPQAKKTGLQPLIQFEDPEEGESAKKKRRVIDEDEIGIDVQTPQASPSTKATNRSVVPISTPEDVSSPLRKSNAKLALPSHTPARPSPLSLTVSTPGSASGKSSSERQAGIEAAGKKRAAQILRDLIDEEIGPLKSTRSAEPIIFNPYDKTSLGPATPSAPAVPSSAPSTAFAGSTPRKSALKDQTPVRKTPLRGAAAKLEAHKEMMKGSRPLTTIERIKGVQPWQVANGSVPASEEPSTPVSAQSRAESADAAEIDENMDEDEESTSATPAASSSTSAFGITKPTEAKDKATEESSTSAFTSKIPTADTFKAFEPPTIKFSDSPLPKASPASTFKPFESKTHDSIFAAAKASEKPSELLTFSLSKPQSEDSVIQTQSAIVEGEKKDTTLSLSKANDSAKIYLSAKDSALKVSKPALPFYTFTLPLENKNTIASEDNSSSSLIKGAKAKAKKSPLSQFVFTLSSESDSADTPSSDGEEWTCSMCMLKNPASAKEKCMICEEPKPKTKSASKTLALALPKPKQTQAGGPWTCSLCMLQNPETATEKCTICEAPKPTTTTSLAKPTFTGFGAGAGEKGDAEWTCSLCMLKNPASAKEKCTICEAPRP